MQPIPRSVLKHDVVLHVCTGVDRYQNPSTNDVSVTQCFVQPSNETRKTTTNTEVLLRGLMFADVRGTLPYGYDFNAAKNTSEANGHALTLTFNGQEFTVATVETLYDDNGQLHHYELGLV